MRPHLGSGILAARGSTPRPPGAAARAARGGAGCAQRGTGQKESGKWEPPGVDAMATEVYFVGALVALALVALCAAALDLKLRYQPARSRDPAVRREALRRYLHSKVA